MNYKKEIDVGMLFGKFYCRRCGERLKREESTCTVKKGDSDYERVRRLGRTRMIGDVQYTTYRFRCYGCDESIGLDEQRLVKRVQKRLGKRILTDEEYGALRSDAVRSEAKKRNITDIIVKAAFIAIVIAVGYFSVKYGLY